MPNTMKGRHAVGGKTARPGSIRSGQSEPQGNRPITASRPAMQPRPPVLTDQNTSEAAQRIIPRPPSPFDNPQGAVNVPAPTNRNFQKAQTAGLPAKGIYGTSKGGYNVTEHSILKGTETTQDMLDAVGEPRKPSGYNSITSGFPMSGAKRQAGRPGNANTNTSKRDNARMRQRPGGF